MDVAGAAAPAAVARLHRETNRFNAARFVDRLTRRVEQLASQLQSGVRVPKYAREDVRQIFEGSYRIVYRRLPDRIDIVSVRHVSRLLPTRMRDL